QSLAESGEIEATEFRARHKNGSWQWLESRAIYHPEPPIEGVIASSRDITDRKQREQELTRYEKILDTLPDSVSIFDANLDCIYVNQTLVDESGVPRDEYLDESIETLLDPLPDAEVQEWIETMERLVAGEQAHARKTVTIPSDTGTLYVDTTAGRIESESGELIGVVNVLRDITERVEAQQEIQRQNEHLENFASFVSHDLRNPLNVAEGHLDLARNECDS
ncbi:MAG: PAS domain S-box protein, partial [Halobacteriaceae archaeon]